MAAVALASTRGSAQGAEWRTDFSKHAVPLDQIVSGGPSKDGIPAIDRPRFVSVAEADRWLKLREPVVVLDLGGQAKAYPLQILIWHEIVNDEVGGQPVTVTYCPLCNTALAFDRRYQGRLLDFGTTGRLRLSDLVMYDRQTETWWQQATGEALVGELTGGKLTFIPAPLVSWGEFKMNYAEGLVLSKNTGFSRPYGRNPYEGYDEARSGPFQRFFSRPVDTRLPPKERVVTIEGEGEVLGVAFSRLQEARVINAAAGERPVAVFWAPGTASAVDRGEIAAGRDVGATGVYDRRFEGRTLTFEPAGDGRFRDRQTGTVWNVLGRGVEGPLTGRRLVPIVHGVPFWFAWAAFRPDTRLLK